MDGSIDLKQLENLGCEVHPTKIYTTLLLFTFLIVCICRLVQSILHMIICYHDFFRQFTNIDKMLTIFQFCSIIGHAPFFTSYTCILFQWAEIIYQTTRHTNAFIDLSMRYKKSFIICNILVFIVVLCDALSYFF
jgi:hypothetical protein